MKPVLLFVALVLSCTLIVIVSAQQCDLNTVTACVDTVLNIVSKDCMAAAIGIVQAQ